jgi:ribose transport system substrate-binding protein
MISRRLLVASVCGLCVVSCGESKSPAVASVTTAPAQSKVADKPAEGVRVALVMKTLTNPFFVEMEKGARKAQQAMGIDLKVQTATQETSIEQQIQLVEQEIQAQAKAIVIAPGDSMRLVPVLKKAQDAGIHVVNIDNRLGAQAMQAIGMKPVPFISVNNEEGAYKAAKFVADQSYQANRGGHSGRHSHRRQRAAAQSGSRACFQRKPQIEAGGARNRQLEN